MLRTGKGALRRRRGPGVTSSNEMVSLKIQTGKTTAMRWVHVTDLNVRVQTMFVRKRRVTVRARVIGDELGID